MKTLPTVVFALTVIPFTTLLAADNEVFVTIQQVSGDWMVIVADSATGRGMAGRGPRSRRSASPPVVVTVPKDAKITSAMRERRTFEFRVGAELAGGLRHRVLQNMQAPLPARIVMQGDRIVEINVIIPETDINQTNTDSSGQTVIAVRPKRPPMKRP